MIKDIPNMELDSASYILKKETKTRGEYIDHKLSIIDKKTGNIQEWLQVEDQPK